MRALVLLLLGLAAASEAAVRSELDLGYRSGASSAEEKLDLYLPEGAAKPPLLVYVHGGAWIGGDKAEFSGVGKTLAAKGVATAVVNYRLSTTTTVRHPMHAEDLAAAIAWLAGADAKYGYDAERIFVAGHSAGAHMAAFLAAEPKLLERVPAAKRPKGYVGMSGIYDVPKLLVRYPGYRDWFLDRAFGADQKRWPDASPARRKFSAAERWLIIHSPGDELVELRQSDDFVAALRRQKIAVELVVPKGDHMEPVHELFVPDSVVTTAILGFVAGKPR